MESLDLSDPAWITQGERPFQAVMEAYQQALLGLPDIGNIGSLLQHFSETLVGGSFQLRSFNKENRRIIDFSSPAENEVYGLLVALGKAVFGEEALFALAEVPMLLSPRELANHGRDMALTKREMV